MTTFDLLPHLAAIAGRTMTDRDFAPYQAESPLQYAHRLYDGGTLAVYCADETVSLALTGIERVGDPEDANVTLIIHRGDAAATAAQVETQFIDGHRVALWDASKTDGRGDLRLISALMDTIIYVGNLASCDTDLERTLATVLVPLRDGAAFRHYLTVSIVLQWIWADSVREEVIRRFGETMQPAEVSRAITQVQSRFGAWLTRLGKRGLRVETMRIGFTDARVDGLWMELG